MGDNVELHAKLLTFLGGEFARKEGRQCTGVDLLFAPGGGFRDEEIRKWVRAEEPEIFENFANVENLVTAILEIAESEADAKQPGRHRFKVITHQHLGGRATSSFALSPAYTGGDESTSLVATGRSGGDAASAMLLNHSGQLMRINQQMFDGSIRVLSQQAQNMHEEMSALRDENNKLRRENEDLRSNREEREFQMHLTMEKNARHNAGFQKLMQLGTIVAAKIGTGSDDKSSDGNAAALTLLLGDFANSLRKEQIGVLMQTLDMSQKLMFMEIMKMVQPKEALQEPPSNGAPTVGASP